MTIRLMLDVLRVLSVLWACVFIELLGSSRALLRLEVSSCMLGGIGGDTVVTSVTSLGG